VAFADIVMVVAVNDTTLVPGTMPAPVTKSPTATPVVVPIPVIVGEAAVVAPVRNNAGTVPKVKVPELIISPPKFTLVLSKIVTSDAFVNVLPIFIVVLLTNNLPVAAATCTFPPIVAINLSCFLRNLNLIFGRFTDGD
jgi:hypothetical protein